MSKSDIRIDVLGTVFTISTDEDPAYLRMLLDKYRRTIENVQQVSGLKDPLKTAVLTGFLLCDDLEKAGISGGGEKSDASGEAELLTLGMISRLSEVVPDAEEESLLPLEAPAEASGTETVFCPLYKLKNTVKNYDWGSPEWIPALLGEKNPSRVPWAELWMGVNPAGPSRVIAEGGGSLPVKTGSGQAAALPLLSDLISADKETFLGSEAAKNPGKLPFLFKVLAAVKPLSIQAHPGREQAKEGFERENREGIPLKAPNRNYLDSSHKPEIFCALGPFAAVCGFRKVHEISALVGIISRDSEGELKSGFDSLISALKRENENPFRAFLSVLFGLEREVLVTLGLFLKRRQIQLERDFPEYKDEWDLCSYLIGLYPGDPGILAPLYLNIIELSAGEAMYIPTGVLHAYIHGMGIELMADSDTVIRGGLSSKHVDPKELLRILDFSEYKPEILKTPNPAPSWFSYPVEAGEFSLSVMKGTGNAVTFPGAGPSIVLLTQGSASVKMPGKEAEILKAGESVFIPARCPFDPDKTGSARNSSAASGNRGLVFSGTFTAYVASAGSGVTPHQPKN